MTTVVHGWTRRSGALIHYLDNAPARPTGLPVLFSPGFTDFASEYESVLECFLPRRAVVVEVRGRGRSEAPSAGYLAADHEHDLRAVLDETGIDRFHLMTFSRGTTWGLGLAFSMPDRVATISIGDYRAREHALDPSIADHVMTTRFRGRPMAERIPRHVVAGLFGSSVHRDLFDDLAALGAPVLVATGTEADCMLKPEALDEYRRRVPGVEFFTVPGAGHDLFRPDRLAYATAVADFAARHESEPA
jgi:pimeloyl-ACP methyl ester carboxylesterase